MLLYLYYVYIPLQGARSKNQEKLGARKPRPSKANNKNWIQDQYQAKSKSKTGNDNLLLILAL